MQREALAQILPLLTVTVFVTGTIVGSFLNVVVWRLPRGESLLFPGSHCPKCNHAIPAWENIPILSWLFLRARCSSCGAPISPRYPLVESATGLLYLALWWRIWGGGMPLSLVWAYFFLGGALLAAALIDLEHFVIPDRITLGGLAVAAALALIWPQSHLRQDLAGTAGGSHLILNWFVGATARVVGRGWGYDRLKALADVALGALFGYGMLWVLLEVGKRLWGSLRLRFDSPVEAVLTPEDIRLGEHFQESWGDLLFRSSDRFTGEAEEVTVEFAAELPEWRAENTRLSVCRNGVSLQDQQWEWQDLKAVRARLKTCVLPREVMGFGDLKLLAMIGAFLGADASIFVLMIAAASGCLVGTVHIVLRPRQRQVPIPFGPFLAGAAIVWVLVGDLMVHWYVRRFL